MSAERLHLYEKRVRVIRLEDQGPSTRLQAASTSVDRSLAALAAREITLQDSSLVYGLKPSNTGVLGGGERGRFWGGERGRFGGGCHDDSWPLFLNGEEGDGR